MDIETKTKRGITVLRVSGHLIDRGLDAPTTGRDRVVLLQANDKVRALVIGQPEDQLRMELEESEQPDPSTPFKSIKPFRPFEPFKPFKESP